MEFERTEVYGDDEVQAYLTLHDGVVFFHLSVYCKPTKSILSKCRDLFIETCLYLDTIGYDSVYTYTPSVKFCKVVMGAVHTDLGEIGGRSLLGWFFEDFLWD